MISEITSGAIALSEGAILRLKGSGKIKYNQRSNYSTAIDASGKPLDFSDKASAGLKTRQAYLLGVDADKLDEIDLTARFVPGATANSLSFADGYTARAGAGARVKRTILVGDSLSNMKAVEPADETAESVSITLPGDAPKVNLFQIRYDFE